MKQLLGSLTLNQLQPLHLQKFYTKKLENGRTDGKGGLSPQSVRYLHAILRKALDHAVKWQIINRNVAKFVDPPPITKIEITTLTSEQVADFLYHAKNDRYYIAFLLAVTTGLRRGALRSFKKILKKASLPDIRLHDIRHTYATLMLQQGEHPKIVSERLGHSNTRVTLDTYSHVLPNMQKDAVERFEKYYLNFNHSQT